MSKSWKLNDNMDSIHEFMDTGIFNHNDKGRFIGAYFFNIEDIKPFMESNRFDRFYEYWNCFKRRTWGLSERKRGKRIF